MFPVKSELPYVGCQYGFFPLDSSSKQYNEFLVFGGIMNDQPYDTMTQTGVLRIYLDMTGEVTLLRNGEGIVSLPHPDRFYFNQYFPISSKVLQVPEFIQHFKPKVNGPKSDLIGVVGREAFHIFNKSDRTWVCSRKELGYQMLFKE